MQATTQRGRVEEVLRTMFDRTCEAIERIDGRRFDEFVWSRDHSGGWLAGDEGEGVYTDRTLLEGNVFEKVGVNYAALEVVLPPGMTFRGADVVPQSQPSAPAAEGEQQRFYAVSTSFVMHPRNPMVPTAHVNYRYFEMGDGSEPGSWWFGGGGDLTPAYLFEEDAVHFHKVHKDVCDRYDPSYYPRFKKWCDEYFYLPHRGECRGVGGIFFDYLKDRSWEELFAFVRECSEAFVPAYLPIVERRKDTPYTDEQKYWHRLHRGRYVEFIVGIDRGTRFGLQTGLVRPHSVLNCMPAAANWQYDDEPAPGSQEAALRSTLRSPRNWV
ncbi:oxygen-dependent coproporphyrinogen oxidase [Gloeobacter kilaueensis]|uniref:oxygen-dependent coproporphyrinogen oxidase n=1 Tax=Gloeobacter kilaueensis TaxID=1416614 RepID=UPI0003F6BAB0|nr:oxygen-dependent coproporphyrinogen oxidase [Gloeobacter kilaueensis]